MSRNGLHVDMYIQRYICNYNIYGLNLECYGIVYTVLRVSVLLFIYSLFYKSLSDVLNTMYTVLYLQSTLLKGTEQTTGMFSALEWVTGCCPL